MNRFRLCFLILVIVLALVIPVGCGGSEEVTQSSAKTEVTVGDTEAPVDPTEEDGFPDENPFKAGIAETVLFDVDGVKITALELASGQYGVSLSLLFENQRDIPLTFSTKNHEHNLFAVNNYVIDSWIVVDVGPGDKVEDKLPLDSYDWHLLGIEEIAELQLGFFVTSRENRDDFGFRLDPVAIKTSAAGSYNHPEDAFRKNILSESSQSRYDYKIDYHEEEGLYEQEGLRFLSQTVTTEFGMRKILYLEVENQSEEAVRLILSGLLFNGIVIRNDRFSSVTINPGWRQVIICYLSDEEDLGWIEASGIGEIGEITFTVNIQDEERYDIVPKETVTIVIPGVEITTVLSDELVYDDKGIRIVYQALTIKKSYMGEVYLQLLVENRTSTDIFITDEDGLRVNGQQVISRNFAQTILEGESSVIELELYPFSAEESDIKVLGDIKVIEMSLVVWDDRVFAKLLAEPSIKISY